MRASRFLGLVVLLGVGAASAQSRPDEDWNPPPAAPPPLPLTSNPLPPPPPPPDVTTPVAPLRPVPSAVAWTPPKLVPEAPNRTSLFGGPMLGAWNRAASFLLGFPLLQVRASLGLTDSLDVGVGFDTMYTLMNEPRLTARYGGWSNGEWTLAVGLEAGWAFFQDKASREVNGARWMTGRRNVNLAPMAQVSYQGKHARAARFVVNAVYTLAFDTEPFTTTPLSGVPPSLVLGHNVLLRVGAELPLTEKTAFVFLLAMDVHTRDVDSAVMPGASLGVVTAL